MFRLTVRFRILNELGDVRERIVESSTLPCDCEDLFFG